MKTSKALKVSTPQGESKIAQTNVLVRIVLCLLFTLVLFPAALFAAPLLRCQIYQGENQRVVDFVPTADPYHSEAVNINGRFRFKAIVFGDAQHVDYVKIYVYAEKKRQPVLLNQSTFPAPVNSSDGSYFSLTGKIFVYEPQLERELQYGCALLEVAQ